MIKVAHLFDTSGPGGAEKVLVTLVRELDPSRFQSIPCVRKNSWMHNELSQKNREFFFLKDSRSFDIAFLARIVNFLKQQRVDVVHSHEFFMNLYSTAAANLASIPAVATVHGGIEYCSLKMRRRLAYRFVALKGCMVTVCHQVAERVHKTVGIPMKRMRTIYNGIGTQLPNGADLKKLRFELGLPDGTPVIGMVGNLYPVKGYSFFIRSMQQVKSRFPDARFIICGRGKLQPELESLARQCGLENSLQFLGFRPDVRRLLQVMDIFVLSSLSEGLSLAILEAMDAGKPTVVTNVGGNPEIVVDGETGFLVPAQNPEALTERVSLLLRDRSLSKQMGQKGRQRVLSLFSRERMVQNYQNLYEALVVNGRVSL
jgi:glycosyltransferase involved in cell wall biosynthesis